MNNTYNVTLNGATLRVYFNPKTITSIIVDGATAYLLPSGCYTINLQMAIDSHIICIAAEMSEFTIEHVEH